MFPSKNHCYRLWDKYNLPYKKRIHCQLVCDVALFIGKKLQERGIAIDLQLLEVASLLHDIDKNVPRKKGEKHPDSAVRLLKIENMDEVADIVATHSLHLILDVRNPPKSWEQKTLYIADKMVKHEIIGVDKRFSKWRQENLPVDAREILERSYKKVKELEREVFTEAQVAFADIKESIS